MRKFSSKIKKEEILNDISIEYSHPQWLIDKWLNRWSNDRVIELLKWNNSKPKIWFRVNILETSIKEIHNF